MPAFFLLWGSAEPVGSELPTVPHTGLEIVEATRHTYQRYDGTVGFENMVQGNHDGAGHPRSGRHPVKRGRSRGSSPRPTPSHSRTLLAEHVAPATSASSPKEDLPLRNECFVPLGKLPPAPGPPRTGLREVVSDLPTRTCLPQGLVSRTFSPTRRVAPIGTLSRYEES